MKKYRLKISKVLSFALLLIVLSLGLFACNSDPVEDEPAATIEENNDGDDDATIVIDETLPREFIMNSEEKINLLAFFSVKDNGEDIPLSEKDDDVVLQTNFDITVASGDKDYEITLGYWGKNGNLVLSEKVLVKVIEEDLFAPVINNDQVNYTLEVKRMRLYENFFSNFTAKDNVDGNMKLDKNEDIIGWDEVDIEKLGTHELKVSFIDSSGNELIHEFTLEIIDTQAPIVTYQKVITTKLGKEIDYKSYVTYEDNYYDYEDLTIEYSYEFKGEEIDKIDFNKSGEYKVKIVVKDGSSNQQINEFRVIIEDGPSFFIIILFINLGIFVFAAITIGMFVIFRKKGKTYEEK